MSMFTGKRGGQTAYCVLRRTVCELDKTCATSSRFSQVYSTKELPPFQATSENASKNVVFAHFKSYCKVHTFLEQIFISVCGKLFNSVVENNQRSPVIHAGF